MALRIFHKDRGLLKTDGSWTWDDWETSPDIASFSREQALEAMKNHDANIVDSERSHAIAFYPSRGWWDEIKPTRPE